MYRTEFDVSRATERRADLSTRELAERQAMAEATAQWRAAEHAEAVAAECDRRARAICPAWRQARLTARRIEIQETALLSARPLSETERVELDSIRDEWRPIAALHAARDRLLDGDDLPLDFTHDRHWTE